MVMAVSKKGRRPHKLVEAAARGSLLGGHSADEIDNINNLGGVVSALVLSFVLGLQYMVAPGTDEMNHADYRSLLCKSQEFRVFVRDVFKTEDIGTHSEEYFNFTQLVRPGTYMDVEQFLMTDLQSTWGETTSGSEHIACIGDKDVQTVVALTFDDFPTKRLHAFALQSGDFYRWSEVNERIGSIAAALVFSALLWSIVLNISLALAPVREDSTGRALVAWLMIGGPMMIMNYIFLLVGLILFFVTHGRQLMALSPFSGATSDNTVVVSLFSILLPIFVLGLVLGALSKIWADYNAPKLVAAGASEGEEGGPEGEVKVKTDGDVAAGEEPSHMKAEET
ncbi:unnamed protein product [Symbiodinium microadriaticum]|nr:unnamed protein product [Symbiodinium microadriaticum]